MRPDDPGDAVHETKSGRVSGLAYKCAGGLIPVPLLSLRSLDTVLDCQNQCEHEMPRRECVARRVTMYTVAVYRQYSAN